MSMRPRTYASYSIGCAAVWGVILAVGRRKLDARTWNELRVVCGGWWMGVGFGDTSRGSAIRRRRS